MGLNDLPLIIGLCLVPMTDFDHNGAQNTNRSKQENSGADKASRECITLMKVEDFALDAWSMLG